MNEIILKWGSGVRVNRKMRITALANGYSLPVCESDCSPPSSAEVKTAWSYTPIPYTSACVLFS